ncbi:MAG TPA: PEP-CTERM sorting domain-containing protein [Candidatus Sulfotelmatobacter sp.]
MKRIRVVISAIVLLWAGRAKADNIPTFYVTDATIGFIGFGDAFGGPVASMEFSFTGPGFTIFGDGTFECGSGWCDFFTYYSPGYPVDFENLTMSDYTVQIGSVTYSAFPGPFSSPWTLSADCVVPSCNFGPATLNNGLILGQIGSGNNTFQFYLNIPPGSVYVGFLGGPDLFTYGGEGEFSAHRSVTPEPSTAILMVTGIMAIAVVVRSRCSFDSGISSLRA